MRIGILQFPGSNCERETTMAVKRVGMDAVSLLWNAPRERLRQLDGFIIVGGFSYEDRSRAGIIAALDPIMLELKQQSELGKPILGICNGAQILVESGLVPGLENNKIGAALAENKRLLGDQVAGTGYYNDWVYMRVANEFQRNAFTSRLSPKDIFKVPVAHAEGRFILPPGLLEEVRVQGLNVFQYCNQEGALDPHFPINPNGSIDNIAALANKSGNVMAMMPHPERTIQCDTIFLSMRDYIAQGRMQVVPPLHYYPRQHPYVAYQKNPSQQELIVELMITDNQAMSVQNSLRQLGFQVKVRRQIHWEIECDSKDTLAKIKQTGILLNDQKEKEASALRSSYLVRAKEDLLGKQKLQTLINHFHFTTINKITHGVLWHFEFADQVNEGQMHELLKTHIIHNPYAHDCYQYN